MAVTYQVGQIVVLRDHRPARIVSIHHTSAGVELIVSVDQPTDGPTVCNMHIAGDGTLAPIGV